MIASSNLSSLTNAALIDSHSLIFLPSGSGSSSCALIVSIENNIVELDVPIFRLKGPRMFNLTSYFKMYNFLIEWEYKYF